jgi:hypothetical protein
MPTLASRVARRFMATYLDTRNPTLIDPMTGVEKSRFTVFVPEGNVSKAFKRAEREARARKDPNAGYSGEINEKAYWRERSEEPMPLAEAERFAARDIHHNHMDGSAFAVPVGETGTVEGWLFYGYARKREW